MRTNMRKPPAIRYQTKPLRPAVSALLYVSIAVAAPAPAQWLQWGGPQRDFTCDAAGLDENRQPTGLLPLDAFPTGP